MARRRLDTKQAAEVLGISRDAVRKRASRGQLETDKGADGKLYIWLDTDTPDQDKDDRDLLIQFLRDQLERAEARDRENRRLLAAALERIPAIEAPQDMPSEPLGSSQTASEPGPVLKRPRVPPEREKANLEEEQERRSWWQRWFGLG
jgi:hypothetical protein